MEKTENIKKKLPLFVKLLLLPFEILLTLIIIVLIWFTFCYFDRIKAVDVLPPDYAVYLRTDSVWATVEPLLDLDATLIAMTSPDLQKYRESYLKVKSSKLRQNFFVKKALQRRLDAAIYGDNSGAIAVLDAGFLSGAARFIPYCIPHVKALSGKVELSSNRHGNFYQFGDTAYFVFKKNKFKSNTFYSS